jgi:hyperosmotically inducible protein
LEINMKPMHQKSLIALSSLAMLLALGACDRNDDRTAGQKLDAAIAKTDQAAQSAKEETKAAAASTEEAVKNAAEATKTAGANAAHEVRDASAKVADATATAGAAAGEKMDDAGITAKVNTGLSADKDLSASKIDVDTKNGVVTLSGPAPSAQAKARATEIARNVKGVSSVNNQLTVRAS